ncbi:MAG: ABC transporter substrate-binding protein [Longicatena sp.]
MKKVLSLLCVGLMAVSMAGCGSSKKGNTFTVGANELTGTFSPIYYSSSYDGYAVDLMYEKLMDYDVNNKLQPGLAEGVADADGKTVTFKLKKGIKFSDGTDFDAKDVEFTFKAVSDPAYDGRYAGTTKYLEGYGAYSQGEISTKYANAKGAVDAADAAIKKAKEDKDEAKQKTAEADKKKAQEEFTVVEAEFKKATEKEPEFPGIKVIDDYTIQFKTEVPRNDNLSTLAASFAIISADQFKDGYKYGDLKVVKDSLKKPIGTGPYVLKKWEAGTGASFTKNKKYDRGGFAIENIVIKPTKQTTEYQELESGNIDMLNGMIEPKKVGPASTNDKLAMNHYPRGGAGYITFNAAKGATADKAVRQALTFAFDRKGFVDSFYECPKCKGLDDVKLGYVPATYNNPLSTIGDVVRGTDKVEGLETYDFNMEKAKQTLDAAGWVAGADGKRSKDGKGLDIKILSMEDHDILANLVPMWQKAWGTELGANVKVATVDFNTLLDKINYDKNGDDWNVFFLATSYTSDGMADILQTFHSDYAKDGSDNYARLKDAELDAMLKGALTEMDATKALAKWKEVAVRINDDATVIPVYGNTYFDLYNKKVKGLKTNALYTWPRALKDATIADK